MKRFHSLGFLALGSLACMSIAFAADDGSGGGITPSTAAPVDLSGGTPVPVVPEVTLGRTIHVLGIEYDGQDKHAAIVSRVNDDGTVNVKLFAGGGGADGFVTGLRSKADHDALEDTDAAKNLPYWDWPARV